MPGNSSTERKISIFVYLAATTLGGVLIQLLSAGLGFGLVFLLARMLGASGYGEYANGIAWAQIVVMFASFGAPTLITREFAARMEAKELKSRVDFLGFVVLCFSLFGAGMAVVAVQYLLPYSQETKTVLALALLSVPLINLIQIWQSAVIGLGRPLLGQIARNLVVPFLTILFCLVLLIIEKPLTPSVAISIYLMSTVLALLIAAKAFSDSFKSSFSFSYTTIEADSISPNEKQTLLSRSFHFFTISGFDTLIARFDYILLGLLVGPAAVGLYAVADRIAIVIGIFRTAMNKPMQPLIASYFAAGENESLRQSAMLGAAFSSIPALIGFIAVLFLGKYVIGVFGDEFVRGFWVLVILSLCQVISALSGNVATLLAMSGKEVAVSRAKGIALVLNIVLNFLLIPAIGIEGAALATLASFVIWNILLIQRVKQELNIDSTIVAVFKNWKEFISIVKFDKA